MQSGGNVFGRAIGKVDHLRLHAATLDQSWIRGVVERSACSAEYRFSRRLDSDHSEARRVESLIAWLA